MCRFDSHRQTAKRLVWCARTYTSLSVNCNYLENCRRDSLASMGYVRVNELNVCAFVCRVRGIYSKEWMIQKIKTASSLLLVYIVVASQCCSADIMLIAVRVTTRHISMRVGGLYPVSFEDASNSERKRIGYVKTYEREFVGRDFVLWFLIYYLIWFYQHEN